MARPTRGFSVPNTRPAGGLTCPSTITFAFNNVDASDFSFFASWSPGVTFAVFNASISINGGPFVDFDDRINATSPQHYDWDLSAVASPGDSVIVELDASGAVACPDLSVVSEQQTLT